MHAYAKEPYLHSEEPTETPTYTHPHTPRKTHTKEPSETHAHTLTLRNKRSLAHVIICIYRQTTCLQMLSLSRVPYLSLKQSIILAYYFSEVLVLFNSFLHKFNTQKRALFSYTCMRKKALRIHTCKLKRTLHTHTCKR